MASQAEKLVVEIDIDLEDIVPGYLENRHKDVKDIAAALERGDFDTLNVLGHRMKGSGAGYGFDRITEIGRAIEMGAKEKNAEAVAEGARELAEYLERVEVVYVE